MKASRKNKRMILIIANKAPVKKEKKKSSKEGSQRNEEGSAYPTQGKAYRCSSNKQKLRFVIKLQDILNCLSALIIG